MPWEGGLSFCLSLRGEDTGGDREEQRLLSWKLSGNRECTEERKSQVTLYTKLVTGILTGEAVVVGVFFPLAIYQQGAHKRTTNVLGQAQALVFVTHQGLWNGGQGLDVVL